MDANMNRSLEGIRVLEESARMLFDDSVLTREIKDIRHTLIHIIKSEKELDCLMLFARGSNHDVLRTGETISEKTRTDMISIVRANASRSQEAVRALEEYVKLLFPHLSEKFKKIRFNLYDIEKTLVSHIHLRILVDETRMALCVIIDYDTIKDKEIGEITRTVLDGRAGTVLFRDKTSQDSDFIKHAKNVLSPYRQREITTIIEERLDIAMILNVDGVCVHERDIPVKACRTITGQDFVIGLSFPLSHESFSTIDNTADYFLVGPVFENEKNVQRNLTALQELVALSPVPIVVFGGITNDNIEVILDYGITGIGLKPDFHNLNDDCQKLQNYRKKIEKKKSTTANK